MTTKTSVVQQIHRHTCARKLCSRGREVQDTRWLTTASPSRQLNHEELLRLGAFCSFNRRIAVDWSSRDQEGFKRPGPRGSPSKHLEVPSFSPPGPMAQHWWRLVCGGAWLMFPLSLTIMSICAALGTMSLDPGRRLLGSANDTYEMKPNLAQRALVSPTPGTMDMQYAGTGYRTDGEGDSPSTDTSSGRPTTDGWTPAHAATASTLIEWWRGCHQTARTGLEQKIGESGSFEATIHSAGAVDSGLTLRLRLGLVPFPSSSIHPIASLPQHSRNTLKTAADFKILPRYLLSQTPPSPPLFFFFSPPSSSSIPPHLYTPVYVDAFQTRHISSSSISLPSLPILLLPLQGCRQSSFLFLGSRGRGLFPVHGASPPKQLQLGSRPDPWSQEFPPTVVPTYLSSTATQGTGTQDTVASFRLACSDQGGFPGSLAPPNSTPHITTFEPPAQSACDLFTTTTPLWVDLRLPSLPDGSTTITATFPYLPLRRTPARPRPRRQRRRQIEAAVLFSTADVLGRLTILNHASLVDFPPTSDCLRRSSLRNSPSPHTQVADTTPFNALHPTL
ncbi:hypothetical protein FZEAL_8226 [Fusarium zealandicum]|uniref:Uncharacterized protein n=1 Tax=Fusarium zealandicum TaxID=1053134 RepID=A0A8H4XI25_9HYPO|nr:hypothetical protein FZEAL_8226 [Fusarium zealandicum]